MTDEQYEKWITAVHEAGHFVMGMLAGGGLPRTITIEPNPSNNSLGWCGGYPLTVEQAKQFSSIGMDCAPTLKRSVMIALAGGLATEIVADYTDFFGTLDDHKEAEAAMHMIYGDSYEQEFDKIYAFTCDVLSEEKILSTVQVVASYLMDNHTLQGEGVNKLWCVAADVMGESREEIVNRIHALSTK